MFGNLGGAKSIHIKGGNNLITSDNNSMVNSNERANSNKAIDVLEVESVNESKLISSKQSLISEQKLQAKGRTESLQAIKPGKLDF